MSAESVGQIGLDLVVNKKGFHKEMTGIESLAKKTGKALAAAFTIKKAFDFGKQCIELGSDLQEVQNVVDVTFQSMNKKVNAFAREAASSFGLSETMAKRFTGTFGAMSKAFGFNEEAAYEMSKTLTGLAGDIASFYNISQDEAYTKLKSVFTGETESLKDLGVVMTQTALDSYALANGFGKTTKNMSETEKVALRYRFVQDQLSAAAGDFLRTSDSWANQVRVLQLQFDSLKASIGQGLINALTPVIQVINTIIAKLVVLADYFRAFTEALFGNAGSSDVTESMAENVRSAAVGMGKTAAAAEKTKKALSVAGFDELNLISSPSDSSGSSADGGGAGGGSDIAPFAIGEISTPTIDTSNVEAAAERIRSIFRGLKTFLEENRNTILAIVGGLMAGIAGYFVTSNWSNLVTGVLEAISTFKAGFITALSGISPGALGVAAIVGVLVAAIIDLWNTSEGFRNVVTQAWELISSAFKSGWDRIWNNGLKPLGAALVELGKSLYGFYESSGLKSLFEFVMTGIVGIAGVLGSTLILAVSGALSAILQAIGLLISGITSIVDKATWLFQNWDTVWNSIKTVTSTIIENVRNTISTAMDTISTKIGEGLSSIKSAWNDTWDNLKAKTTSIFTNIWSTIKTIINCVIGGVEKMANGVISAINKMIEAINKVADVVPGIDSDFIPTISPVKLPRLAQGGYVRANTPQLAMIGDNRHHGEIVAPEDKLLELLKKAISAGALSSMSGLSGIDEDVLYRVFKRALEDADIVAIMDSDKAFKSVQTKAEAYRKRTGKPAFGY